MNFEEAEKRNKVHESKGLCANMERTDGMYSIEISDFEKNKIQTIEDEFIVKNANYAFTADNLIVHSDYGVLSIYDISNLTGIKTIHKK